MKKIPFYLDIFGWRVVFIGGGKIAERKISKLLHGNPEIVVVGPELTFKLEELSKKEKIIYYKDYYKIEYLQGADMVFAATDDPGLNKKIFKDAIGITKFVNVSKPGGLSTFFLPYILESDEIVISINSRKSNPKLVTKIGKQLEETIWNFV